MSHILVTGSNGQLGTELQKLAINFPGHQYIFTDVEELDICKPDKLKTFLTKNRVDYVINCAAYTAVDKAESEPEPAYQVNASGPQNLAKLSTELGFRLIHISTDFVFDGTKNNPYTEEDFTNPISLYGKSKLAGEKQVMEHTANYLIIRTSWLYSAYGNNFVKTMIRYGKERGALRVVNDQFGSPTWADDLAECILHIIGHSEKYGFSPGIYHFSNDGAISWFEFAKKIIELSGISCSITPISTSEYPTPAARPAYSVMDKTKIQKTYSVKLHNWKKSLKKMLGEYFM